MSKGKKEAKFTIREAQLAEALEITRQQLDQIVKFFDSDPNDQWELTDGVHFIYSNKSLDERLFSELGAYAIAKYLDEKSPKNLWSTIKEFITRHKEKIRNAFISDKIQDNCSSLTTRNNRHFLSKRDVVGILCTSYQRLNKAFDEIKVSPNPMIISEDFDDIDGERYYSLSGLYKFSRHLSTQLTVKDRRSWCAAIEVVGKKTFKMILDQRSAKEKRIEVAMNAAKKRDAKTCRITGIKRDKHNKSVNIVAHHIYSKEHYEHLAACVDNLITLTQEVHNDFHAWNGGYQKPCTADHLIQFVQELHPDNYEVIMSLKEVKRVLNVT
ncbi:MAG: hypothetical protein ACO331_06535 [Prochlorothrix sp.]